MSPVEKSTLNEIEADYKNYENAWHEHNRRMLLVLKREYEARLKKKFAADQKRLAEIAAVSEQYGPVALVNAARKKAVAAPGFLPALFRALRGLDDDVK